MTVSSLLHSRNFTTVNSNKGSFIKIVSNNLVINCWDITVSFSEFPVTNNDLQGLVKSHYINYIYHI